MFKQSIQLMISVVLASLLTACVAPTARHPVHSQEEVAREIQAQQELYQTTTVIVP